MAGEYTTITDELKNAYPSGSFPDAVNKEAKYRKSLNRVNLKMSEGIATFPLALESSWNVSMIADNTAFPTTDDPTRPQGQVNPELFVGDFAIGVKTKYAASSQVGSFNAGGILADRVERTVEDLAKYLNMVYAGSVNGRLAIVEADGASATFTCSKPLGVELLREGMRIDEFDALTGGTVQALDNVQISEIDPSTNTVTYDATDTTLTAGYHIFVADSYGRTPQTLPMIVDDGTLAGTIFTLSRTTYPGLKCQVNKAGGVLRDLTEQLILDSVDEGRRRSGKKITRALSNTGQARKYVEFVAPERRYAGNSSGKPSYVLGYEDEGLKIVAPGVNCHLETDFDISPRVMYFLAWDTFGLYEAMPLDWLDEDSMLNLLPNSSADGHKAGFVAYVGCVENQINTMPKAQVLLGDLKDPICGD